MPDITVEKIESPQNWDEVVDSFQGSLFIKTAWLKTVAGENRVPVYFRFKENGKMAGLLGGLDISLNQGKTRQLFFYSGIVTSVNEPGLIGKCKTGLFEYAKRNHYMRLSIRSYDYLKTVPGNKTLFKIKERVEYIVRLDKSKEDVINGIHKDMRRKVRRACEMGMTFHKSRSVEMIDELISVTEQTYRVRQIKGYGPYEHFYLPFFSGKEMRKLVSNGHGDFFYTMIDNEILSIGFVFCSNRRAYALFAGTTIRGYKCYSPSFLFYNTICKLKDKGFSYFNVGGVQHDERNRGLKQFKDKLGADVVTSFEECSNFLTPPYKYLNPLLDFKYFLLMVKVLPWRLKKAVIFVIDKIIKKRDCY